MGTPVGTPAGTNELTTEKTCPLSMMNPAGEKPCIRDRCQAWERCQQPEMCFQCDNEPEKGSVCIGVDGFCTLCQNP